MDGLFNSLNNLNISGGLVFAMIVCAVFIVAFFLVKNYFIDMKAILYEAHDNIIQLEEHTSTIKDDIRFLKSEYKNQRETIHNMDKRLAIIESEHAKINCKIKKEMD